jgi:5-methylcytosine-specific restriction enzyme A
MIAVGHSGWIRRHVYERDHGVCALCGADAARTARLLWKLRRSGDREAVTMIRALWGRRAWDSTSLWEADHLVPLSEGGAGTLQNLRTLCRPCHVDETKALRARLAQRRAIQRRAQGEGKAAA